MVHPGITDQLILSDEGLARLYQGVWSPEEADRIYSSLVSGIEWQQPEITVAGRKVRIPRLQCWFGDKGAHYQYSGLLLEPESWSELLMSIKTRIERLVSYPFNSALVNYYRDGSDSVGWHSDDEPELGKNPVIASASFGQTRRFVLQHKGDPLRKFSIDLGRGDLLLMSGALQHCWRHQLPKTTRQIDGRVNVTFRRVRKCG